MMEPTGMLTLMALLLLKHYVADFPLQRPFMFANKGTYGDWGGIAHAAVHGLGTFLVVEFPVGFVAALWFGVFDGFVHYHIDWAKVKLCFSRGWSEYVTQAYKRGPFEYYGDSSKMVRPHLAIYSNAYFQALGVDQLAHAATYVLIAAMIGGHI